MAGDAIIASGGSEHDAGVAAVRAVKDTGGSALVQAEAAAAHSELSSEEEARGMKIFRMLDKDFSGVLEISALDGLASGPLGEEMLSVLDSNGDGVVSPHEWVAYLALTKNGKGESFFNKFVGAMEGKLGERAGEAAGLDAMRSGGSITDVGKAAVDAAIGAGDVVGLDLLADA